MPKICVALAAAEPGDLFYKADLQVRENTFLEFRLDYLKNPLSAIPGLKRFFEYRPDAIGIATCRRANYGGKFRGSLASEIEVLIKSAGAGCQIIDLELESAEAMKASEMDRLRSSVPSLLISHHDFEATKRLEPTLQRIAAFAPDFYKVVTTANSLHDNLVMLNFLQKYRDDYALVGLCMGETGVISRVLGVRAGAAFTFASSMVGEPTAPGQVSARDLQDTFRIEQLDAATRVYGVAGNPVRHSLSPALMNAAMRRENVNAVYLPLAAQKIEELMACVRELPIHGLSVTMPYKEQITAFLDNSDQLTAETHSCNTVVRSQDGQLIGFNTDIAGILAPLDAQMTLSGAKALVIGAGGAARAAVYALKRRDADVYILNRTPAHAQKLVREFGVKTVKRAELPKMEFAIAINATPLGMGSSPESPLNEKELKSVRRVFDLVYNPAETRLIQMARAQGIPVISGVEMFVHQAARQFEIWTGKPAPVEQMRNVVLRNLGVRAQQPREAQPSPEVPTAIEKPEAEKSAMVPTRGDGAPKLTQKKTAPPKPEKKAAVAKVSHKPAVKKPIEASAKRSSRK